jgi:hypothetical protein
VGSGTGGHHLLEPRPHIPAQLDGLPGPGRGVIGERQGRPWPGR